MSNTIASRRILRSVTLIGLLLAFSPNLPRAVTAQAKEVAGPWTGVVQLPGGELKIDVTLARSAGSWSGTIDIPAQGALALPLGKVAVDGSAVSFTLPSVPGEPAFTGTLAQDGAAISGTFTQAGQTFPFKLLRKADPSSSAASALEGFDQFVESAMKSWNVPGLAVAIVKTARSCWRRGTACETSRRSFP